MARVDDLIRAQAVIRQEWKTIGNRLLELQNVARERDHRKVWAVALQICQCVADIERELEKDESA